jgi:hypothetical protein
MPATPQTVTIGRTEYRVEPTKDDDTGTHPTPYRLLGPRGAVYLACRNQRNPRRLFLVNGRSVAASAPKVWLREREDGSLEVLR